MSQQLNEAVIKLINEDVVNGRKIIENELYQKLGKMLEEKLVEFAPTIFEKKHLSPKQKKIAKMGGDPEKIDAEDFKALRKDKMEESVEETENVLSEEYEQMVEDLQALVESIEQETGEELSESEIEELAEMLLEEYESDEDMDEDETEEEDLEKDSEDEDEDE